MLQAELEPDSAVHKHSLTAAGSENSSAPHALPVLLGNGGLKQDLGSQGAAELQHLLWELGAAGWSCLEAGTGKPSSDAFYFFRAAAGWQLLSQGTGTPFLLIAAWPGERKPSHLVISLQQPQSLLSAGDFPLAISDYFWSEFASN